MKIAVATLNRYLKKSLTSDQIVAALNRTEIEVEEVIHSDRLDPKIILVKTVEVEPHPEADRLRLVTVSTGKQKIRVVCGAPNVTVGQRVALVQPGSVLPDGTEIHEAKLRGVVSHGMLASGKELGVSDDHSGILVFEEDTHPLGTSLCDIVFSGDVLDIKTPANRWDFQSGVGIAREIALYADAGAGQGLVEPDVSEYTYKNIEKVNVKVRGENQRFVSARLTVRNDVKSPQWLVDNLEANGFVAHNPVVDITNFVMLETGQPSHAYDATKLSGPLTVRFAKQGEKITTLDELERSLSAEDLVVADTSGAIGIAGIMGGASTQIEVTTTEIILEAAHWDKSLVRKSAQRHGLRTEASARFERGLPLPLSKNAFGRLLDLLVEICDAKLVDGPNDQLYGWPWQQFLGVRIRQAEKFLGITIPEKLAVNGLRKLGFGVEHFSLSKELKQHLGKPYKWGANFREDGESAFDCSYLVDRVYSKLGIFVGHTALGQFHTGRSVEISELKPGDVLFIEGLIKKSVTDHYYLMDIDGTKRKHVLEKPEKVGHNGIYLGNGQVLQAAQYEYRQGSWVPRDQQGVIVSPVEEFIENPGYLGARRYIESFNHILAVEVPWWRMDVRLEVDMYEELAKIVGYDSMPETLPDIPPMPAASQSSLLEQMRWRSKLIAMGGTEVATYSFISEVSAALADQNVDTLPRVANPRSPEQLFLRSAILPSHLELWQKNASYRKRMLIFEFARVFSGAVKTGIQPKESWQLAMSSNGQHGIELIQGFLLRLLEQMHVNYRVESPAHDDRFVSQRSARILTSDGQVLGVFGQIVSSISTGADLVQPFSYAELDFEALLAARKSDALEFIPDYQLVVRDMSLELSADVTWQMLKDVLATSDSVLSYEYLDQYQDEALQKKSRKSITLRIRIDGGPRPDGDKMQKTVMDLVAKINSAYPEAKTEIR